MQLIHITNGYTPSTVSELILVQNSFSSLNFRSTHQRCFVRKEVLRNFAKVTGKHSLFFKKGDCGTGVFL